MAANTFGATVSAADKAKSFEMAQQASRICIEMTSLHCSERFAAEYEHAVCLVCHLSSALHACVLPLSTYPRRRWNTE